jgi:hypothetical protein
VTPLEIAEQFTKIAYEMQCMLDVDGAKFDSTVFYVGRIVCGGICKRVFNEESQARLDQMLESLTNNGVIMLGVWWAQLWAQCSGDPATTGFNTINGAHNLWQYFSAAQGATPAWVREQMRKCMFFGDDAAVGGKIDVAKLIRVAKRFGFNLTVDESRPDTVDVPSFLARKFPNAWSGDSNSTCDLPRTLSKLHLQCSNLPIDEILWGRASGLLLTDAETPVVGYWAQTVVTMLSSFPKYNTKPAVCMNDVRRGSASWWAQYDCSAQWPNEDPLGIAREYWAQRLDMREELLESWAEEVMTARIEGWDEVLAKLTSVPIIVVLPPIVFPEGSVVHGLPFPQDTTGPAREASLPDRRGEDGPGSENAKEAAQLRSDYRRDLALVKELDTQSLDNMPKNTFLCNVCGVVGRIKDTSEHQQKRIEQGKPGKCRVCSKKAYDELVAVQGPSGGNSNHPKPRQLNGNNGSWTGTDDHKRGVLNAEAVVVPEDIMPPAAPAPHLPWWFWHLVGGILGGWIASAMLVLHAVYVCTGLWNCLLFAFVLLPLVAARRGAPRAAGVLVWLAILAPFFTQATAGSDTSLVYRRDAVVLKNFQKFLEQTNFDMKKNGTRNTGTAQAKNKPKTSKKIAQNASPGGVQPQRLESAPRIPGTGTRNVELDRDGDVRSSKLFGQRDGRGYEEHVQYVADQFAKSHRDHAGGVVDADRLMAYARAIVDPFNRSPVQAPVNHNNVPTMNTTCARTSSTYITFIVPAGQVRQLSLFLHGNGSEGGSGVETMTPHTFGCARQAVGGGGALTAYCFGPMNTPTVTALSGVLHKGLLVGESTVSTTGGALGDNAPVFWDSPLPYLMSDDQDNVRFQPTALGLRAFNVTEQTARGGSVTSYIPQHRIDVTGTATKLQTNYAKYTTFRIHGVCDEGLELIAVPRGLDEAFWAFNNQQSSHISDASMLVWFNNSASVPQTFIVEIAAHWEIGGNALANITRAKVNHPANENVNKPAREVTHESGDLHSFAEVTKKMLTEGATAAMNHVANKAIQGAGAMAAHAARHIFLPNGGTSNVPRLKYTEATPELLSALSYQHYGLTLDGKPLTAAEEDEVTIKDSAPTRVDGRIVSHYKRGVREERISHLDPPIALMTDRDPSSRNVTRGNPGTDDR